MSRQRSMRRPPERKNRSKGEVPAHKRSPWFVRVVMLLILVAAGLGGWFWQQGKAVEAWVEQPESMPVKRVVIHGEIDRVRPVEIRQRVQQLSGDGMIALDLMVLRDHLEQLPWVDRVRLRKRWPETVEVWIEEQQAVAVWGEQGYLNRRGEFFDADGVLLDHLQLPVIVAHEQRSDLRYRQLLRFKEILRPSGGEVAKMEIDRRGSMLLELRSGLLLNLGRAGMERRLARWSSQSAVIMSRLKQPIEKVDLRYERGMAVKMRDVADG